MINSLNFTSKIDARNVSIYDLDNKFPKLKGLQNGTDYEIEPTDFRVYWSVDIETREWGIKDIDWSVTLISGDFDIVYFDANGSEKEREPIEFDFNAFAGSCEMENDLQHQSLSVDDIDIDYASMSVSVR